MVVHPAVFMEHSVYACEVVALIFRNGNSLIMRCIKKSLILLPKHLKKHNVIFFIECLVTEIVETYKNLARIRKWQEKQCLQKWWQNSDFWSFLIINISKLSHRIITIFFLRNMQLGSFWLGLYLCHLHFFTIVIIHFSKPSFPKKSCSLSYFGRHFD